MNELRGLLTTEEGTSFVVSIRPTSTLMPVPNARRRTTYPKVFRDRLLRSQDNRCAICHGPVSFHESHLDHIIPLSAGGADEFANLQLTHMSCNLRKGKSQPTPTFDEGRMPWAMG
jgi:5-methylcytosine-specific restriction endonuclease McrA